VIRTADGATARAIIDANGYMTLATADASGLPWATPVWFAPVGYREFLWVSSPEARHSRNLAERPQLGIVFFDSRAPIGTGQGVYMSAPADRGDHRERIVPSVTMKTSSCASWLWAPGPDPPGSTDHSDAQYASSSTLNTPRIAPIV
jgi:hypothetical protein